MTNRKNHKSWRRAVIILLCGGAPLTTAVSCDTGQGSIDVFREDSPSFCDYSCFPAPIPFGGGFGPFGW